MSMRLLAIGDVHGCFTALRTLWELVQPAEGDEIVFLGDYVDRGSDSRGVIEWLAGEGKKPSRVFLRGNHEVMMLDARDDPREVQTWQSCGGLETLISYGAEGERDWASRIPESHWKFLQGTVRGHETAKHLFVHACLDPKVGLEEQSDDLLFWETFDQIRPHKSGKKIVCGHTTLPSAEILDVGFAVCLETGAAYGGWLTCLDVHAGRYWQANEGGETNEGVTKRTKLGK